MTHASQHTIDPAHVIAVENQLKANDARRRRERDKRIEKLFRDAGWMENQNVA